MLSSTLDSIGILDAGIVAVLGYIVVFFGLILLAKGVAVLNLFFIETFLIVSNRFVYHTFSVLMLWVQHLEDSNL